MTRTLAARTVGAACIATCLSALMACGGREAIHVVEAPPDAQSVVVLVQEPDTGAISVFGGAVRPYAIPLDVGAGTLLFVAFFPVPLDEMDVAIDPVPDTLSRLSTASSGVPIANWLEAWTRVLGDKMEWGKASELPMAFAGLQLARTAGCGKVDTMPLRTELAPCPDIARRDLDFPFALVPTIAPGFACDGPSRLLPTMSATVCAPFEPVVPDCGPAETFAFETQTCVPLTTRECAAWPPAEASAIYVRPGGMGSGTIDAPLGSIQDALTVATDGAQIVVASGRYTQAAPLALRDTRVLGACVAEVIIEAPDVALTAGAVPRIEGVTLRLDALTVDAGSLTISDTRLETTTAGIVVRDAALVLDRARLVNTHSDTANAVLVVGASAMTMTDVLFDDAPGRAFLVRHASTVTIDGLVIRRAGDGIVMRESARLDVRGLIIDSTTTLGIDNRSTAATNIDGLLLRNIGGEGIFVDSEASFSLRRAHIDRARNVGIRVRGGTIDLDDVVIGAILGPSDESGPAAIDAYQGAHVTSSNLYVRAPFARIDVHQSATATLTNVVIQGDKNEPSFGDVVRVTSDAHLKMTNALIRDAPGVAVLVRERSTASLDNLIVQGARPASVARPGRGISSRSNSRVTVNRASILDTDGRAIEATTNSVLEVSNTLVSKVTASLKMSPYGDGIDASNDSTMKLFRVRIEGVAHRAIGAFGSNLELQTVDVMYPRNGEGITVYAIDEDGMERTTLFNVRVSATPDPPNLFGSRNAAAINIRHSEVTISNTAVDGSFRDAIRLETLVPLQLTAIQITNAVGRGLVVTSDVLATIQGVKIVGTQPSLLVAETTAMILPNSGVTLDGFEIRDTIGAAILFDEAVVPRMQVTSIKGGLVHTAIIGILTPRLELRNVAFQDVFLENVEKHITTF